jgi:hypothetical protein
MQAHNFHQEASQQQLISLSHCKEHVPTLISQKTPATTMKLLLGSYIPNATGTKGEPNLLVDDIHAQTT